MLCKISREEFEAQVVSRVTAGAAAVARLTTSAARGPSLPFRYHDTGMVFAQFTASLSKLRELLPSPDLHPVEASAATDTGLLVVVALEHRQPEQLAPYNEVSIMIPVVPGAKPDALTIFFPEQVPEFGFYVHRLPVTTQEACDAGIAIWGFPKVVGDIRIEEEHGQRVCTWYQDNEEVLCLTTRTGPTQPDTRSFRAYSMKDGTLLQCSYMTSGGYHLAGSGEASITLGTHSIADELRAIGLGQAAMQRIYAPSLEGVLTAPVPA